nr:cytochrome c oxidase subunit II [Sinohyriopsis cumingii]
MSLWGQMGLQEGGSVLGVEVGGLYDYGMFIIVLIFSFVGYLLLSSLVSSFSSRVCLEKQWLEVVWTIVPFFLLLALGLPSIKLLYLMDEINLPESTVKVVGHQWYWSYEYSDSRGSNYSYDSYMVSNPLVAEGYRLLEVDNRCVVANLLQMRGLVTSDDVIHSWAIPSSSIKIDGVPGRVNQVGLCFTRSGVFYGQCSELCGVNHSFMPISVEVVSIKVFSSWVVENHDNVIKKGGDSNQNSKGWSLWGLIVGVAYWVGKGVYFVGKAVIMWHYYLLYYSFYVPGKFLVFSSWDLLQWVVSSGFALGKWAMWFWGSPGEASLFALHFLAGKFVSGVWFVVTSPVKAAVWAVKGVWSGVVGFISFCGLVFDSVGSSLSSFTDDSFKGFVVSNVSRNTKEFLWTLSHRY